MIHICKRFLGFKVAEVLKLANRAPETTNMFFGQQIWSDKFIKLNLSFTPWKICLRFLCSTFQGGILAIIYLFPLFDISGWLFNIMCSIQLYCFWLLLRRKEKEEYISLEEQSHIEMQIMFIKVFVTWFGTYCNFFQKPIYLKYH